MGTALYLAYLLLQSLLLAWGFILVRQSRGRFGLVALMVVSAALVYDTAVVSAGHAIGESELLRQLQLLLLHQIALRLLRATIQLL